MSQINAINEWEQVKLSDIAEITSGGTPLRKEPKYWNGYIPWVKTGEINGKLIKEDDIEEFITEEGLKKSSTKMIPSGSILMAMYGQGQTRGRVAKLGLDATINQACAAIILKDIADTDFIFQQLLFSYDNIRDLSNDGGQKNLSSSLIKSLKVFLAPLPEQQKIAEILSTWDEAIEKLESLIERRNKKRKKLLKQLLFGHGLGNTKLIHKLGEIASPWNYQPLSEISKFINRGITPDYVEEGGIKVINQKCIRNASVDLSLVKYTKLDLTQANENKLIQFNDICVNSTGQGTLGRTGLFNGTDKVLTFDSHVTLIRIDSGKADPVFISYFLHMRQPYIEALAEGSSGQEELSRNAVNKLLVPMPPFGYQQKVGKFLLTYDEETDGLTNSVDLIKKQKQGLMQKLLTGRVRVKN